MSFATANERYLVQLLNATREANGLAPLRIVQSLNDSADQHSRWMLAADTFSHDGSGGSSASERMERAGFPMVGESWGTRENLAYVGVQGEGDLRDEIRQLHQNLLNSPEHYRNIMDPTMTYIGVGLEVGSFQGHSVLMATQNFGRTTGQPVIDDGIFPVGRAPAIDAGAETRATWLADGFDGVVRVSSPDGAAVNGTARADDFRLDNGADVARGYGGDDWMRGGAGSNALDGGLGNDRLIGGGGFDRLLGRSGHDVLDGYGGNDRLEGHGGNDLLRGGDGHDTLLAAAGRDTIAAGAGNDRIIAGDGNDQLSGGAGADVLQGGAGNDTLDGGRGNDILNGGQGADTFVFRALDGADRISGYQVGIDRIMIDDALLARSVPRFYDEVVVETASGVVLDLGNGHRITIDGPRLTAEAIADDILLF